MGLAAFNRMRRMQAEKEALTDEEQETVDKDGLLEDTPEPEPEPEPEKKKPSPKKKESKPKGE
jgi:hypothetical protein